MKPTTLDIAVFCKSCNDGNNLKAFQDLMKQDNGDPSVMVNKAVRTGVSYQLDPRDLKGMSIDEWISNQPCRVGSCRKKTLERTSHNMVDANELS